MFLSLGWATSDAHGELTVCDPVPGKYTVYLSGPSDSKDLFPDSAAQSTFLNKFQFELQRDTKWIQTPGVAVSFKVCSGRLPAMDGTDFDAVTVKSMEEGRVIMEVWGRLANESTGVVAPTGYAQLNYFLVPVSFAAKADQPNASALERLEYRHDRPAAAPNFVDFLIAHRSDLDALAAAAIGFDLLDSGKFESAQENLCIAVRKLQARTGDDIAAIRDTVTEWAGRAIKKAKADPGYSKTGKLQLYSPSDPCSSGRP
jgi:hypothetical protein